MSLPRQDVVLGRALLAWRLVDRAALLQCADEVRRRQAQGRSVTLGQVLVERGLLSLDRYHAIVARLHQVYLESSGASPQVQQVTEQVPFMGQDGRYTRSFQRPAALDQSGVERAVAGWQHTARDVAASGSDLDVGQVGGGVEAGAAPTGPDAVVRRRLNVPPGQARFPIGAWLVEEYLDAGNYGIVYRVSRPGGDGRPFALKVLKQLNPSAEVRQRFVQEARTMAKLSHPGIVHVHDAGVAGGLLWFVMDFLQGKNLGQLLEARGRLGLGETLAVIGRLCKAVAYAHEQGILHRDLKPDNVILGPGQRPILTDFGLAKDTQSNLGLTQEGQRIGTPLYMAPELLLGTAAATVASEVYSLGAMLYQCLTGKVPFHASSLFELVEQIEAGDLPPLGEACPDATPELDALCRQALHKEPAERPASVADFAAELVRVA